MTRSEQHLSAAQWGVLTAAYAGQLHRDESGAGRRRLYAPFRRDGRRVAPSTVDSLHSLGLLTIGEQRGTSRPLILTDEGRAVMASIGYTQPDRAHEELREE